MSSTVLPFLVGKHTSSTLTPQGEYFAPDYQQHATYNESQQPQEQLEKEFPLPENNMNSVSIYGREMEIPNACVAAASSDARFSNNNSSISEVHSNNISPINPLSDQSFREENYSQIGMWRPATCVHAAPECYYDSNMSFFDQIECDQLPPKSNRNGRDLILNFPQFGESQESNVAATYDFFNISRQNDSFESNSEIEDNQEQLDQVTREKIAAQREYAKKRLGQINEIPTYSSETPGAIFNQEFENKNADYAIPIGSPSVPFSNSIDFYFATTPGFPVEFEGEKNVNLFCEPEDYIQRIDSQMVSDLAPTANPAVPIFQSAFNQIYSEVYPPNISVASTEVLERRVSTVDPLNAESAKKNDEFEEMQPQQMQRNSQFNGDYEQTPMGPSQTPCVIDAKEESQPFQRQENSEDSDSETQSIIMRYDMKLGNKSKRQNKRRGAPFKGNVSNNKVEKFKPQRQGIFRSFKQFYERRIMPGIGIDAPKRKRNKDSQISEADQRKLTENDIYKLLGAEFLSQIPDNLAQQLIN